MVPPFIPVPWQGAGQTKYHADTGGVWQNEVERLPFTRRLL